MPTYTFKNKNTEEVWTEIISIAERDKLLEDNPHYEQLIVSAPAFVDPYTVGRVKATSQTQEILKRIHKANKGSTIQTGNLGEV